MATGLQLGVFLYEHFRRIPFALGGCGSFVYHLGTWGELVLGERIDKQREINDM